VSTKLQLNNDNNSNSKCELSNVSTDVATGHITLIWGLRNASFKVSSLLGCDAVSLGSQLKTLLRNIGNYWLRKGSCTWTVRGIVDISFISIMVPIFWDMTLNGAVEGYRRSKGKYSLYYLSSLTHITNTTVYSETSLHISQKIRRYPPDDSNIHRYHYENLQPYTSLDHIFFIWCYLLLTLHWSTNFGWLDVTVMWIHYLYFFGSQDTKISLKFFG
jgi:hypothetical protein